MVRRGGRDVRRACEVEPCVYPRAFICYPTFYREFYRIWVEPSHPPHVYTREYVMLSDWVVDHWK